MFRIPRLDHIFFTRWPEIGVRVPALFRPCAVDPNRIIVIAEKPIGEYTVLDRLVRPVGPGKTEFIVAIHRILDPTLLAVYTFSIIDAEFPDKDRPLPLC